MVDTKRKPGAKIQKNDPLSIYNRNRTRYYNHLVNKKISTKEYNKLMDKNLEEFQKNNNDTSLKEFTDEKDK
jgi:flagellar biosynthesis chaperone FliJ